MKTFTLRRSHDETGVSGTGVVLEGVQFTDGHIAVRWRGEITSTSFWESLNKFLEIHVASHPRNRSVLQWDTGAEWNHEDCLEYVTEQRAV